MSLQPAHFLSVSSLYLPMCSVHTYARSRFLPWWLLEAFIFYEEGKREHFSSSHCGKGLRIGWVWVPCFSLNQAPVPWGFATLIGWAWAWCLMKSGGVTSAWNTGAESLECHFHESRYFYCISFVHCCVLSSADCICDHGTHPKKSVEWVWRKADSSGKIWGHLSEKEEIHARL